MEMIFPLITEEEVQLPFYLTSIGSMRNQDHTQRPEGYPNYHWLHCMKGKGVLLIGGNEYTIPENTGFFFRPGVPHEYYPVEEPWETHWLTFNGSSIDWLLDLIHLGTYSIFHIHDMPRLERMLSDIYTAARSTKLDRGFECSHLLYRFLLELNHCIGSSDVKQKKEKYRQLAPVLSYLEKNLANGISLEEMASVAGVTPQHLCRLFKHIFHMRPFEYLTGLRMQKAKEMLVSSGTKPLKEIAAYTGYSDTSYFCAVFKEHEGMTPMEFRKMHR